jgi:hypothetical protein
MNYFTDCCFSNIIYKCQIILARNKYFVTCCIISLIVFSHLMLVLKLEICNYVFLISNPTKKP